MAAVVEHRYAPRGACRILLEARDDEVLLSGPAGTGKSRACLAKLHLLALLNPGMRALILRKTLVSLTGTALVTWREHVAAEAIAAGIVTWYGGSQQEAAGYRYSNGSRISVGGLDRPTKIMSSEYDVAYVQEAIELVEGDWEVVTSRLRNGRMSFQQLIADTNPDKPAHWLKQRCDAGKTRMLDSRHEDNPVLFDEVTGPDGQPRHVLTERGAAYIGKLDRLTGPRYYRLRKGLWVSAEGLIYDDYDPALHLVDPFDIPADWPRYWAVDFGYTAPFVCQWWAQDPDGRLFLYREIYFTKRTVDQHAVKIMEQVSYPDPDYQHPAGRKRHAYHGRVWTEPKPRAIICDHDAEGRAVLDRELGMSTKAAHKAVTEGIQAFQARLRPAGDGRPRIAFLRDSVVERDQDLVDAAKPIGMVEEIPGYVWDTGAGKKIKETPLKLDDHSADAARYVVAELDLRGRARVRWLG